LLTHVRKAVWVKPLLQLPVAGGKQGLVYLVLPRQVEQGEI